MRIFLVIFMSLIMTLPVQAASTACNPNDKTRPLLDWIAANTSLNVASLQKRPEVRWYRDVEHAVRVSACGGMCDSMSPKVELNMYIVTRHEIWLNREAREDQLIHELVHALQYSDDPNIDATSDDTELAAVRIQQAYANAVGRELLCVLNP